MAKPGTSSRHTEQNDIVIDISKREDGSILAIYFELRPGKSAYSVRPRLTG